MADNKKRTVCTFCLMMRFMLVFFGIVAVFLLNGIYHFWS